MLRLNNYQKWGIYMRKFICLILTLTILLSTCANVFAEDDIKVILDGEKISFDTEPFIFKGRVLVPIRKIAEAMDFNVEWYAQDGQVLIENGKKRVIINIEDEVRKYFLTWKDILEEGIYGIQKYCDLDVPAQIHNGRTYIPIRAIAECFGAAVAWDDKTKTVLIETESGSLDTKKNGISKPDVDVENYEISHNAYEDKDILLEQNKTITLKNQKSTIGSDIIKWSGITMLPIKQIAEALGYTSYYDPVDNTFNIQKGDCKIALFINKNFCYRYNLTEAGKYEYDTSIYLETPPVVYENKLYTSFDILNICFDARISVIGNAITVDTTKVIDFKDKVIEGAVRTFLGNSRGESYYTGLLTQDLVEQVTAIRILDGALDGYFSLLNNDLTINTLEDIKQLPNLDTFVLRGYYDSEIDISPLEFNKKWKHIDLWETSVKDISVFDRITVEDYIAFPKYDMKFQLKGDKYAEDCKYSEALLAYKNLLMGIEKALGCIDEDMTDYEKYKALHDYLLENMEYDYAMSNKIKQIMEQTGEDLLYSYSLYNKILPYEKKYGNKYTLEFLRGEHLENSGLGNDRYVPIVKGKGVCNHYAAVYMELCNLSGLECEIVLGKAGGEDHGWNEVKLDGKYYHVDVTWDDTGSGGRYEYFMLTDEELRNKGTHRY